MVIRDGKFAQGLAAEVMRKKERPLQFSGPKLCTDGIIYESMLSGSFLILPSTSMHLSYGGILYNQESYTGSKDNLTPSPTHRYHDQNWKPCPQLESLITLGKAGVQSHMFVSSLATKTPRNWDP